MAGEERPISCIRGCRSMLRQRTVQTMAKKIENAFLDDLPRACGQRENLRKELPKALPQRKLGAELTEHFGYGHGRRGRRCRRTGGTG